MKRIISSLLMFCLILSYCPGWAMDLSVSEPKKIIINSMPIIKTQTITECGNTTKTTLALYHEQTGEELGHIACRTTKTIVRANLIRQMDTHTSAIIENPTGLNASVIKYLKKEALMYLQKLGCDRIEREVQVNGAHLMESRTDYSIHIIDTNAKEKVGSIYFTIRGQDGAIKGTIELLSINPKYRNKGYGEYLKNQATNKLMKEHNATLITWVAQPQIEEKEKRNQEQLADLYTKWQGQRVGTTKDGDIEMEFKPQIKSAL